MMAYRIVPMQLCHVDGVAALHAECFAGERWTKKMIAAELDEEHAAFAVNFAAVSGERVLGFVNARLICDECGINDIAVTENARKCGIGAALLAALEQYAKAHDGRVIQLEVRASNQTAIRFYEQHGFVKNGLRKRYYSDPVEDALLYEKELTV